MVLKAALIDTLHKQQIMGALYNVKRAELSSNFAVPAQINQLKSFLIHSIDGLDEKTQLKKASIGLPFVGVPGTRLQMNANDAL